MKKFSDTQKSGLLFSAIVFCNLIIQFALGFIWMIYASAAGAEQSSWSFGFVAFAQFVLPVTLFLALIVIIKNFFADKPKSVFFAKKTNAANIMLAIVFGFLIYFVTAFAGGVFQLFWEAVGTVPSLDLPSVDSFGKFVIFLVVFAILPAISEEFIYRGAIFHYSQKGGGRVFAIIFSAVCFSLMHMNFYQIGYAFVAGLLFALFMVATKDIWFVVVMHCVNNSISILTMYLQEGLGNEYAYNVFGLTTFETVMAIVSALIFVGYFVWYFAKEREKEPQILVGEEVSAGEPPLLAEKKGDAVKTALAGLITCFVIALMSLILV